MKVFMTGGTGFVGTTLMQELVERGHRVTVLTRSMTGRRALPGGASYLEGDPTREGAWQEQVGRHEVVINLAGATIFKRWTKKAKQAIRDSRLLTTRNLAAALSNGKNRTQLLLSTSAVGYYGFCGDEELREDSPAGNDFLATVVREWEAAAREAEKSGVRVVLCRFGLVLGRNGGTLGIMAPVFRWWLGSPLGSGRQWFSWIHERDLVRVHLFLIEKAGLDGPVNCTAPGPVTNRELTRTLAKVLGKPAFLPPVPGFMVRLVMGEFGSVIVQGQRVVPGKLPASGFRFQFPELEAALRDLL